MSMESLAFARDSLFKDTSGLPTGFSLAVLAFPYFFYPWKMPSGKKADTVTLGRSTMLLTFRSTATLQMM